MKNIYKNAIIKNKVFPFHKFFIINEANVIQLTKNLLTYDIETTGISPIEDDITQIAFTVFSPTFEFIEEKSFFCKLKTKKFEEIDEEIIRKTKITKEKLENGVDVKKAISELLRRADNAIIASYNGWGFDDKFITAKTYKYLQRPLWPNLFVSDLDILLLAIGAFFIKDEKMSLRNIANLLKVDFSEAEAHNAQYDVFITTKIIPGIIRALYADKNYILDECILRFQKINFRRWRFKRYEDPWPSTDKQRYFAKILLKDASKAMGIESLMEWGLMNVLEEGQVLNYLTSGIIDFIDDLSKAEISELIGWILYLKGIGVIKPDR